MKYFILLCVVAGAFAAKCGQNQHYNSCGTACPLTCDNYDNPPKACVLMCNPGCHCDAGYVKTANGECVKPEECPAKSQQVCGLNERYNECGTACPLTCDNYKNPPKFCNKMCKIGCECEEGYVRATRAGDKRCVKPEQCPLDTQVCGLNERFTDCGTSCPLTCDNYKNPPKFCNLMCNIGCECEEGYVRATRAGDKRCVKPEQCPLDTQVCGLNEHYTECGTSCPLTCDNHKNPPKMCNLMCNSGCFCDEGYVRATRASDKRCVKPAQCPLDARYKLRQSTEACDLPAETGVCRGFFPRFYFDRTTGQCEKFIYGGCGGNENNFESVEECQQACDAQASEDVCELPSETGLCRGYFPRYYFNKISGQCEKFVYGGCGGNGNNFHSLEDCQKTCS